MVHCVPFDLADTSNITRIVEQQVNIFKRIDFCVEYRSISQRARIDENPIMARPKDF